MTKTDKTIAKFKQNPATLPFHEIESLLVRFGFQIVPAKGSHRKFKHPPLKIEYVVPVHNGECKSFYKKEIAKILKHNNLI